MDAKIASITAAYAIADLAYCGDDVEAEQIVRALPPVCQAIVACACALRSDRRTWAPLALRIAPRDLIDGIEVELPVAVHVARSVWLDGEIRYLSVIQETSGLLFYETGQIIVLLDRLHITHVVHLKKRHLIGHTAQSILAVETAAWLLNNLMLSELPPI